MDFNKLPDAYKKGYKDFLGIKIDLSKRPLIPREETECWVDTVIEEIKERIKSEKKQINCLDLFSGSGCIGIAVLSKISEANCDFGEIDDNFLEQIKINLDLNKIDSKRYNIIKSDVFFGVLKKYDFILANPPYVAEKRIDEVGRDVIKYEPSIALFAGSDGMDFIKIFLNDAFNYLKQNGCAFVEIDPQQKELIEQIMKRSIKDKNYSKYEFLKDQFGKVRVLKINK
ncbi:MAG: HemK family protein methyltransferase [Candidatus Paceibacterota bacterium]|jgi:release factor glutamine methyltransferase